MLGQVRVYYKKSVNPVPLNPTQLKGGSREELGPEHAAQQQLVGEVLTSRQQPAQ